MLKRALVGLRIQNRGLMQKLLTGEWQLGQRFDPSAAIPRPSRAGGAA
jgi:hypothetical protein